MVSRSDATEREFYGVFDSVDDCVIAAFDEGLARVTRLIVEAAECEHGWHERVGAVLSAALVFLDEEPSWARLLLADLPIIDAAAVSERRQKALAALARALATETQSEANSAGWFVPSAELTGELVIGGVFSVLRARLLEGAPAPFAELTPSLTAFTLAPYQASGGGLDAQKSGAASEKGFQSGRLPIRTTYRTTRVLSAIGDTPGLNNREIAEAGGLSDEGQTSKLLRRLERRGLVENFGLGQPSGGANAWQLTAYGERVLGATRHSLVPGAGAVVGQRVRGAA